MSDHRQHGLMMARPPRRTAPAQDADAGRTEAASGRTPGETAVTMDAGREASQRVAGLFGRFFHRRNKPG